jgi:hypothetical protein
MSDMSPKFYPYWASDSSQPEDPMRKPDMMAWLSTCSSAVSAKTLPEAALKIQDLLIKIYRINFNRSFLLSFNI